MILLSRWIWTGFAIGVLSWGMGESAWADQAAFLSREQAIQAGNQIDLDQEVRFYCRPCRDLGATSMRITQIGVYATGYEDYFELWLNEQSVDLAYTYVPDGDQWHNLAMLLGIEVVEVPKFLPSDLEIMPAAF